MTLELQAALPEELAQKITETAARRGLPEGDFLILLLGLSMLPQMRLSENRVVRDLSDELMLFCQSGARRAWSGKAARRWTSCRTRSQQSGTKKECWRNSGIIGFHSLWTNSSRVSSRLRAKRSEICCRRSRGRVKRRMRNFSPR